MFRRTGIMAIIVLALVIPAGAQEQRPGPIQPNTALTNKSIVELVKAGFSDDLVVKAIRTMESRFDLSPQALLALKNEGVTEAILSAMLATREPAPAASIDPAKSSEVPDDVGVYLKRDHELRPIVPELVTWRSGGVMKSMLIGTKGHINGVVQKPKSELRLGLPVEFVIRLPETVDIVEYQLLRLDEKKDRREFRALTGGFVHASGGSEKNAVPFRWKKIAPRTYRIHLDRVPKGEYGFLPPAGSFGAIGGGASGTVIMQGNSTVGKIYTFCILE